MRGFLAQVERRLLLEREERMGTMSGRVLLERPPVQLTASQLRVLPRLLETMPPAAVAKSWGVQESDIQRAAMALEGEDDGE